MRAPFAVAPNHAVFVTTPCGALRQVSSPANIRDIPVRVLVDVISQDPQLSHRRWLPKLVARAQRLIRDSETHAVRSPVLLSEKVHGAAVVAPPSPLPSLTGKRTVARVLLGVKRKGVRTAGPQTGGDIIHHAWQAARRCRAAGWASPATGNGSYCTTNLPTPLFSLMYHQNRLAGETLATMRLVSSKGSFSGSPPLIHRRHPV